MSRPAPPEPIRIRSAGGDYAVEFVASVGDVPAAVRAGESLAVIDRRVAELHGAALASLTGAVPTRLVDATEEEKTLAGVERLLRWMQAQNATKRTTLIAVGGGIVQDLVTFAAHVYYRGIAWRLVPTTLLSMADSCIGAKCGINLGSFKNQVGAFHSPSKVVIASAFVDTLDDRDVASGHGEILKLMLTGSEAQFAAFARDVASAGLRTPRLAEWIGESLRVKKRVIEEDEYETDLRRILNYGHTFGHALEALTEHAVPHGLAVAWGIDLVNFLAWKRGMLDRGTFDAVHDFVARHLRCPKPAIAAAALIAAARRDKKVAGGQVSLALLERPGSLRIVPTPFDAALDAHVAEYLDAHDVFDRP